MEFCSPDPSPKLSPRPNRFPTTPKVCPPQTSVRIQLAHFGRYKCDVLHDPGSRHSIAASWPADRAEDCVAPPSAAGAKYMRSTAGPPRRLWQSPALASRSQEKPPTEPPK